MEYPSRINTKRVKRIKKNIKSLFYKGRYAKESEKSDGFVSMLVPSMLSICICVICLAGSTFAWFTASQSTSTQTITAANYKVETIVKKVTETEDIETVVAAEDGGAYTLETGTYTVVLTATGDATTGYCIIKLGETEIYKQQLKPENTFEFALVVYEDATLEITYQWGTAANPGSSIVNGSYTYGTAVQPVVAEDETEQMKDLTEEITSEKVREKTTEGTTEENANETTEGTTMGTATDTDAAEETMADIETSIIDGGVTEETVADKVTENVTTSTNASEESMALGGTEFTDTTQLNLENAGE